MGPEGQGFRSPEEGSARSGRGRRGRGGVLGEAEALLTLGECSRGKKAGGRRDGRPWRAAGGGGRRAVQHGAVRIGEACNHGDPGVGGWWVPEGGPGRKCRSHKKLC